VLIFRPGRWLAVIDQLDAPDEHRCTQWFHFAPELEFEAGQRVCWRWPTSLRTPIWSSCRSTPSGASIHLHWSADAQTEGFTYHRAEPQRMLQILDDQPP
jgi:hypothetical protein